MKTTIKEFEATATAMLIFLKEYNSLYFITDNIIRFDTAKKNFKNIFLENCNCELCQSKMNKILNLEFIYE
jgi:hypothetical protein